VTITGNDQARGDQCLCCRPVFASRRGNPPQCKILCSGPFHDEKLRLRRGEAMACCSDGRSSTVLWRVCGGLRACPQRSSRGRSSNVIYFLVGEKSAFLARKDKITVHAGFCCPGGEAEKRYPSEWEPMISPYTTPNDRNQGTRIR